MKRFLFGSCIAVLFLLSINLVSAYAPTISDIQQVKTLNTQLDLICSGNNYDVWSFSSQIRNLLMQFSWDEQLNYLLNELNIHLTSKLALEKNKAKIISKEFKQHFLQQYLTWEIQDIPDILSCTGWYNTLDTISFANNFPTALTMATRYRESNCGYYLPANHNWPFQILSKDYWTWAITETIFLQSVQDFIDFSKAKWQQYKTKLWINLTYTGFDWTGLVNHAGLYNGWLISWWLVNPTNPKYVYDGYGDAFSGAIRYGLLPKFLKVLNWEVESQY